MFVHQVLALRTGCDGYTPRAQNFNLNFEDLSCKQVGSGPAAPVVAPAARCHSALLTVSARSRRDHLAILADRRSRPAVRSDAAAGVGDHLLDARGPAGRRRLPHPRPRRDARGARAAARPNSDLDEPAPVRYLDWLGGLVHGRFRRSRWPPAGRSPRSWRRASSTPCCCRPYAFLLYLPLTLHPGADPGAQPRPAGRPRALGRSPWCFCRCRTSCWRRSCCSPSW